MDEKYSYALESLFNSKGFDTRLVEVENARQEKIKKQLVFGALILAIQVTIAILSFVSLVSIILAFTGSGIAYIFVCLACGGVVYKLIHGIEWAKSHINIFVKKHNSLLFYLRKDAVENFVKIIFPNAEYIAFDPQISSKNQMKGVLGKLFYDKFHQYVEKNTLSFTINNRPFYLADVEPVYILGSQEESVELDKFVDMHSGKPMCYVKGILYHMEYEKDNLNSDFSTVIVPRKATPSPTKEIRGSRDSEIITVSKDYPSLRLIPRGKRRSRKRRLEGAIKQEDDFYPERFVRRGHEEYSVENMTMEDEFYVFTNDENASRKLLSYRLMEKIVKITLPQDADGSQPKIIQLLLSNQKSAPNFWIQFVNITRVSNKPLQKLTVLTTNKNLNFFELTGEKSCKLNNFIENFQELNDALNSIIVELSVVTIN